MKLPKYGERIDFVLEFLAAGLVDGEDHKQAVRVLVGSQYPVWVEEYQQDGHVWETGTPL